MKKSLHSLLFFIIFTTGTAIAQEDAFLIGHSLINFTMPQMLDAIADSKGHSAFEYDLQIINGSSLKYNWENSANAQGSDSHVELATGNYNNLILTEAVPLQNHLTWSDSYNMSRNFANLAFSSNPFIHTYIYETWHCINSGTPTGCPYDDNDHLVWRDRLDLDLPKWESIADSVNATFEGEDMLVIPGGQGLKALYDSIQSGYFTEVSSINDIFEDDIHMNDVGNYFIACIMYATLYEDSPIGATENISNEWNTPFNLPESNTMYTKLQLIAWSVVSNYERSGATDIILASSKTTLDKVSYKVVQTGNKLIFTNVDHATIFNINGSRVTSFDNPHEISTSTLKNGIYSLSINGIHSEKLIIQH